MSASRIHILVVVTVAVALGPGRGTARAQSAPTLPVWEFSGQIGYLPLYGGDATVGSIDTWAPSARVAYRVPVGRRRLALEAYFAHARQDHNPYDRAPAFTFAGALARISLGADPRVGLDPFLGIGVGRMRVDVEEIECPPPNCIREGGPGFRDARLTTLTLDGGMLVPLARWIALRGDVRLYSPYGESAEVGNSVGRRIEYAVGLSVRL